MEPQRQEQPGHESRMHPRPEYGPLFPGAGRLDGKAAVITGGDSGIGRAVAVLFAREGADVSIVYLEETEDAAETLAAIQAEGGRGLAIRGDVGDPNFCRHAIAETVEAFGHLDVLVNNAAEQHDEHDLREVSAEQLERTFRTNVFGYFYMTQSALDFLGKGAAIINTTSVTAYRGSPHLFDYAASRGAVLALTRSLATALAPRNIRVNGVAPGPIWTPLIPATFDDKKIKSFGKSVPLGRPGQPNEVAPSYLFLACADSGFMTGQVLHPNGGEAVGS